MFASKKLLSVSQDSKTVKGQKLGYLTGILYLAPDEELCANGKNAGCIPSDGKGNCLFTAGRAAVFSSINEARARKTREFREHRQEFLAMLKRDIEALIRKAAREGLIPVVRLNGTSDIPWENIRFEDGRTIFEMFPSLDFYDYTKLPRYTIHPNYHLTASFSSRDAFQKTVAKALRLKMNIAVVFQGPKPASFWGLPVIDGDESDVRLLDGPRQVVVGLKAKGSARQDTSGFVVHTNNDLIALA